MKPARRTLRSMLIAVSMTLLSACGGGGGGDGSEARASRDVQWTGDRHGLFNAGNMCAISSVVQLLMHDAPLREQAQGINPQLQLDELYAAYESEHNTARDLDRIYRSKVLNPLWATYIERQLPGQPIDVVDLWNDTRGLGMPLTYALAPAEIEWYRSTHGARVFSFAPQASATYSKLVPPPFVAGPDWPGPAHVKFRELPDPDQVRGLVYSIGTHFVSYIRVDGAWWRFDDAHVKQVDASEVESLDNADGCGIPLVVYEP